MGTAFFASASTSVIELSTRAVVGAAILTIVTILMVTYFRHSKVAIRLMFAILVTALFITSVILCSLALGHITSITDWGMVTS